MLRESERLCERALRLTGCERVSESERRGERALILTAFVRVSGCMGVSG